MLTADDADKNPDFKSVLSVAHCAGWWRFCRNRCNNPGHVRNINNAAGIFQLLFVSFAFDKIARAVSTSPLTIAFFPRSSMMIVSSRRAVRSSASVSTAFNRIARFVFCNTRNADS